MVATAATSAFFVVASPSSDPDAIPSSKPGGGSAILRGIKSRSAPSGSLQVKANAQAPLKINGTTVGYTSSAEGVKTEDDMPSPPPRTFINQLPDWSMLLVAITTLFLAAEKQWMMLDSKPRRSDMLIDSFGLGKIVQDGLVFKQNFSIRSYEIGVDRTASIETLMNHLQIYIPMHDDCPGHWFLCIINLQKCDIHIYDSLRSNERNNIWYNRVKKVVECCQKKFKLGELGKDISKFPIEWPSWVPTQNNGWDCGIHVIKHMQTLDYMEPMKSSMWTNSALLRRQVTVDLVFHEVNKEKARILSSISMQGKNKSSNTYS